MTKRLLLCDDEIHILRAAQFKLARAGFQVRTASDGEEGWEAIVREKPDMVVTDYQMPRLDGFGLVRRIRECPDTADLPVLMLTAKGFELSHDELAQRWGVRAVMAKPFSPRELLQTVQTVLGMPTPDQVMVDAGGSRP
jgi:two-component system, OmpR family, alkaline phosphatase synthesis response regulator PhoP